MRKAIFLVLLLISFVKAEENWITIPEDIQKRLEIKTAPVQEKNISVVKKYPAVVKDDLTMSQAVYSPIEGIIKKLYVKEGDKVRRGQKLVAIYSPELARLRTEIKRAKVEVRIAKSTYERDRMLYNEKLIPYRRYLMSKQQYENAVAKLRALQESLRAYGETSNGLLFLRAGINGYIAQQNVVLGDSVDINKLIFKIHSHRKLWVVAYVPVKDLTSIYKGQVVKIISPLGETTGKLDFISHKVDPKTKRVEARIIADNRNGVLKPNMYVDVEVPEREISGLFVPVSAVVKVDNKTYVFIRRGNKFKAVPVFLGKRYGKYYEVLNGLKPGDEVVVKGAIYLKAKFFGEAEE